MLAYFKSRDAGHWYRAFVGQGVRVSLVLRDVEALIRAGDERPDVLLIDGRSNHLAALTTVVAVLAESRLNKIAVYTLINRQGANFHQQYLDAGATGCYFDDHDTAWAASQIIAAVGYSRRLVNPGSQPAPSQNSEYMLAAVLRHLEENMFQLPQGHELKAAFGLTPKHLQSLVWQRHRITVSQWLQAEKMRYATYLLVSTDQPIQDIASELGYSSSGNFSTAFRLHHGKTPRQCRTQGGYP